MTWTKLKHTLPSAKSQFEKTTFGMTFTTWHSSKNKTMETVKTSVVARVSGEKDKGWLGGTQDIFRAVKTILNYSVMVGEWHYAFVKTQNI